ncbi:hypothetical protein [Schlesneria paludicola]|uniref:hypothetical protein n=1 Tax=Schlesneria paludicola TaxID=360056 RepID=UPI0012FAC933|nr:hypothetical protein [Schlesneria paludicola]
MNPDAVEKEPTHLTALWTHTVLNQPGKKGIRGFGGRLMFHGKEANNKPVLVDGTLTVYAFDETERSSTVPERKFVFTPEQFAKHHSVSKLGHSYSVWLPWDEVGGEPRRINLVARFEPAGGAMILSENALQYLPGIAPDNYDEPSSSPKDEKAPSEIQQAGYQQSSWKVQERTLPTRLNQTTDTIDLPPSFSRRLGNDIDNSASKPNNPTDDATIAPGLLPDAAEAASNGKSADASSEKAPKSVAEALKERKEEQSISSQQALMERKKELSDHFQRRRSQVQREPSGQSRLSRPPFRRDPQDELSSRLQMSSPEQVDLRQPND